MSVEPNFLPFPDLGSELPSWPWAPKDWEGEISDFKEILCSTAPTLLAIARPEGVAEGPWRESPGLLIM